MNILYVAILPSYLMMIKPQTSSVFSNNKISLLPLGLFDAMHLLTFMDASDNLLTTIQDSTFEPLTNLGTLFAHYLAPHFSCN